MLELHFYLGKPFPNSFQEEERRLYRLTTQNIQLEILQLMMSAYSVMDPVNKYRHGVLIGNFVQDKFGNDLNQKGPLPDAPKITTTKQLHTLNHSLYKPNEFISSQDQESSQFYKTSKIMQGESYKRPESQTTYHIYHQREVNQQVPLLQNNPKRQERYQAQNRAYEAARLQLSNKFSRPQGQDISSQVLKQQIPDILTGEIFKAKASLGGEVKVDQKGKPKIEGSFATKSINPFGTYSVVKPQIQRFQEVEYRKFVYPHHQGEKRDVLFGHGIALQDFQRRQLSTTYDLSYNQKVPPQTQVNSFYEPGHQQTAREFHKETLYEKNHQPSIPASGTKAILSQEKAGRPYQPYTGTFDYNHLKNEYLRK